MALQKSFTFQTIELPEAYFKIDPKVITEHDQDKSTFVVIVYPSALAREDGAEISRIQYMARFSDLSTQEGDGDYRDRLYRWLKKQEGWIESIDC